MTATLTAPVGAPTHLEEAWQRQAILAKHTGSAPATALDESQKVHIVAKWSKDREVTLDLLARAREAAASIPRLEQQLSRLDYLTGRTDELP